MVPQYIRGATPTSSANHRARSQVGKAPQFLHVDLMTRRPPSSWAGAFSKLAGMNEGIRRLGESGNPTFRLRL